MSRPALEPTQPPFEWVQGFFHGWAKGQGREINYSLPYNGEVKNEESYTSVPHKWFCCLVRENCTFSTFTFT
jgi:hypothetical protein